MKIKLLTFFIIAILILSGCAGKQRFSDKEPIRAYDIDFNRGEGGPNGFAAPGLWADADPAAHIEWYASMGCNVIQLFAVSGKVTAGFLEYKDELAIS